MDIPVVVRRPLEGPDGSVDTPSTFARAVLSEQPGGGLAILSVDTGDVIESFARGRWIQATGYDENGQATMHLHAED